MILEMMGLQAFLKFVMGVAVTGLGSSIVIDLAQNGHFEKIKTWEVFNRVKRVKGFDLPNGHSTVIGITQHGKTFATMQTLKHLDEAVFFFNVQHELCPSGFTKMNGTYPIDTLIRMLKKGKKVNYLPNTDVSKMGKELEVITKAIYEAGEFPFRYVIDEVHLFSMMGLKGALNECRRVATTGLKRGYKGIFLSQRPANMDNTLYTQSTNHIIFALGNNDQSYLKGHGFPIETIVEKTRNEKYRFVVYDNKTVEGAYIIAE